ncbi:hypothetical protein BJV74DRAFT_111638 [Russula compacta]|nr:hypothetical protein BJV74DRAFT_111638 [Russula compacta]
MLSPGTSVVSPHGEYVIQKPFAVTPFQKSMCRDKRHPGMTAQPYGLDIYVSSKSEEGRKAAECAHTELWLSGTLTTTMVIPDHADDATSGFEWGTAPTGKADIGKRIFRRAFVCACMWSRGPLRCSVDDMSKKAIGFESLRVEVLLVRGMAVVLQGLTLTREGMSPPISTF